MKPNLRETGIKTINTYAEILISRFPQSEEYISKIDLEEDRRITKRFFFFFTICILFWLILTFYRGDYSFSTVVIYLCFSFVLCFTILGLCVFRRIGHGPLPDWALGVNAFAFAIVMVLYGENSGNLNFLDIFREMLDWLNLTLDDPLLLILAIFGVAVAILFATIGVMYIISAYLRRYLPSLFVLLLKDSYNGVRGPVESFFMVPDFVDVKDVVLEPEIDFHKYDAEISFDVWLYIMIMGVLISSYLFINPLFLETISSENMLAIMFMLAIFVPALIFPWMVVKDIKAQAITDAPRPYYLWNGAKRRLFSSFLTLGAFMMLLLLSLYYGYSIIDIVVRYLYLLVPLGSVAFTYSVLYTNNFRNTMKVAIFTRFNEKLKVLKEGRSDTEDTIGMNGENQTSQ